MRGLATFVQRGSLLSCFMHVIARACHICPYNISSQKKRREAEGTSGISPVAPRKANREADRLANGFTQDVNPAYECVNDLATVPLILLPRALDEGRQAEQASRPSEVEKTATQETGGAFVKNGPW